MTRTGNAARPPIEERAESLGEWLQLHVREVVIAAVAVLIVAAGIWFYRESRERQMANASAALGDAVEALNAGNLPLAQSDLEKLIQHYGSTPSGKSAGLLLAQVLYRKGQYQQGVQQLEKLTTSGDENVVAGAYNLMGAGFEEMGKYADAAESYRKAADHAQYRSFRDNYRANQARALISAGKTADAVKIWDALANDPTSGEAAEARVRLGELQAKAAKS